jgi:hypothetical protein
VQDAAYESLLRSKRQQLHSRIANVLKEQFTEIIERQPELMAHHLLQAGLVEPAIDYLQRAGHRAIQRSANTEAIGHLKHALELLHSLSKNPERARTELELEVLLGQAMIAGRGYAANETKQVLLRAKNLIDNSTTPSQKFAILYGLWACYYVGGEVMELCAQKKSGGLLYKLEKLVGRKSIEKMELPKQAFAMVPISDVFDRVTSKLSELLGEMKNQRG